MSTTIGHIALPGVPLKRMQIISNISQQREEHSPKNAEGSHREHETGNRNVEQHSPSALCKHQRIGSGGTNGGNGRSIGKSKLFTNVKMRSTFAKALQVTAKFSITLLESFGAQVSWDHSTLAINRFHASSVEPCFDCAVDAAIYRLAQQSIFRWEKRRRKIPCREEERGSSGIGTSHEKDLLSALREANPATWDPPDSIGTTSNRSNVELGAETRLGFHKEMVDLLTRNQFMVPPYLPPGYSVDSIHMELDEICCLQ
ncbi:hypothetical protein BJ742DRAFT_871306 [Cladochytrium replicatum]|nr:hypothetical protein BJ742DRAFT_871306 [Cladochytrium replicatum]